MKTFVGGEGCVKTMLALLFILLKVRKIWAQIHNKKKKKDCYKAASNRSSGVEKTDIIPSPWLNSQAEMCIAYWGSDTVPLFYRKSLCCTACMSAWPCHRARATQTECWGAVQETTAALEQEWDLPPKRSIPIWHFNFHQRCWYTYPDRLLPASPSHRWILFQGSKLAFSFYKYEAVLNNRCTEVKDLFPTFSPF